MKYFLIAGERSGDIYGGNLIKALLRLDDENEISCYGGNSMQEAGGILLDHYKDSAFMGFYEVLANIRTINRRLKKCKRDISEFRPDVLILIDYPGFNLRMAKFAHQIGIKTAYYISPKIWAWKKGRIKQIKTYIDEMYVIFPFEVAFYQSLDYPVTFVGNPLVEHINNYKIKQSKEQKGKYSNRIAFLPGSRKQEVLASIEMIKLLAAARPDELIWVAGVDNLPIDLYSSLDVYRNVKVEIGRTYEILNASDAAIVTSGTATLEAALWKVPQVVCYRTNPISYAIAKAVVKIRYISLVNLIADREVVKELIQNNYNLRNVTTELDKLLNQDGYRNKILLEYDHIRKELGNKSTSELTAKRITQLAMQP
jgi:lipid-A-disaccharide synthase